MRQDSREYVDLSVTNPDPLQGPVEVAFDDGPWSPTEMIEGRTVVLVGPGTPHELTAGVHRIAVRFVSSPEVPVLNAGRLYVEPVWAPSS